MERKGGCGVVLFFLFFFFWLSGVFVFPHEKGGGVHVSMCVFQPQQSSASHTLQGVRTTLCCRNVFVVPQFAPSPCGNGSMLVTRGERCGEVRVVYAAQTEWIPGFHWKRKTEIGG